MGRFHAGTARPDDGLRSPQPGNEVGNHGRDNIPCVKDRLNGSQRELRVVGVLASWIALEFSEA